jgi:aerobic C4-dicarboxylate transport protein
MAKSSQKLYQRLYVQVVAAIAVGALLGALQPDLAVRMQPLGDGFIRLIRMLIAPVIFCTVAHGIAGISDLRKAGRVALKAILYFEVATTLALIIGLAVINLWRPGIGMNVDPSTLDTTPIQSYTTQAKQQTVGEFLMNIIPATVVGAFADGEILQVLLFSILFGVGLFRLGERGKPLVDAIQLASKALSGVVNIVMRAAPLGAFGAIAFTVGKYGVLTLVPLLKLMGGFYVTCMVFVFVALGTIARMTGFSILKLVRYIKEELLVVLGTASFVPVLPRIMAKLTDLGCEESVTGLVIPTGYSFNLNGTCIYLSMATVFLAHATNTPLTLMQQLGILGVLLITSKGAAGVSGAAFIALAATLSSLGTIPVASITLILGIHRFMSEAISTTNLIGNAVATIVVAKWEGALDVDRMRRTLDQTDHEASASAAAGGPRR